MSKTTPQVPDDRPGKSLQLFEKADSETRALIATQLERNFELDSAEMKLMKAGLWMGFTATAMFLAASVYLVGSGHDVAGTVLGTVDLVSLVAVFVLRRR